MNELIHICRSVANSENAIQRLNHAAVRLAQCVRKANTGIVCLGVAGLMLWSVVAIQDKEIKALQKQVSELTAKPETHDETTEEQNQQEGA